MFPVARWTAAERDDVTVRILDVEVLRAPRGRGERLEDWRVVCDAALVERFDPVDACGSIEMFIVAPVLTLRLILGRFLQVQLQSVQIADGVEAGPRFAKLEPELLIVRNR